VYSRAARKPLVAIILSILKCMFYSRSISSAGVLTPPHNLVYTVRNYSKPKSIKKWYYHVYSTTTACIILGLLRGSNDLTATTGAWSLAWNSDTSTWWYHVLVYGLYIQFCILCVNILCFVHLPLLIELLSILHSHALLANYTAGLLL